jgi:predicted exporter
MTAGATPQRKERALRGACGAVVVCGMALFVWQRLEVSAGLDAFLDDATEQTLATVSRSLLESPITRTMIVAVDAGERDASLVAAAELESALRGRADIAAVRSGPPPDTAEAVHRLYFPHRMALLSSDPERELPARLSDAGLRDAAKHLRRELSLPTGALIQATASEDPLLGFIAHVRRLERTQRGGSLAVHTGRFVSGTAAIVFVETAHSPFFASAQEPLEAHIAATIAALRERHGEPLTVERSGAHRFSAAAAKGGKRDAAVLSTLSGVTIAALFFAVFRSLPALLAACVPLLVGVLTATTMGLWLFGKLHVLTLAFGSTLIGVCIDYPIHVLTHHAADPRRRGARAAMRRVLPALLLGAGTTVGGFLGIASSGLPGIHEIGVFAAVGVVGALAATILWLPWLAPASPRAAPFAMRAGQALRRHIKALAARSVWRWVGPAIALAIAALGAPRVVWLDDVFALSTPADAAWLAEEERVRARVSRMESGRFIVAIGDDTESALARNDALFLRLEALRERGAIEAFQSLHTVMPSAALQARNLAVIRDTPELGDRALAALREAGFRPAAFAPFAASLAALPDAPLRLEDLAGTPLHDWVAPFRVDLPEQVAILTLLRGAAEPAALAREVSDLDGVLVFDQRSFLQDVYGRYRTRTIELLGVGLAAVALLLFARYRRPLAAAAVLAPPVLACVATLGLLAQAGVPINLMHLLGLLLVLSIGVDYCIFLVEVEDDPDEEAATSLCLVIACLSTLLAFGLLALSSFPALRALGAATGIGVLACLLLAPTALAVRRPGRRTQRV